MFLPPHCAVKRGSKRVLWATHTQSRQSASPLLETNSELNTSMFSPSEVHSCVVLSESFYNVRKKQNFLPFSPEKTHFVSSEFYIQNKRVQQKQFQSLEDRVVSAEILISSYLQETYINIYNLHWSSLIERSHDLKRDAHVTDMVLLWLTRVMIVLNCDMYNREFSLRLAWMLIWLMLMMHLEILKPRKKDCSGGSFTAADIYN